MIHDLVTKEFRSKKISSLVWKEKVCWDGASIAELFGYTQTRRAVYDCIKREGFEEGVEYDTLSGEELKEFKEVFGDIVVGLKFAPKIVILYESGLYGFLAYTKMPLGVEFRTWIRNEVMPTIRKKGYYVMDGAGLPVDDIQKDVVISNSSYDKFSTEKMERYRIAFETAKMFEPMLDKLTKDTSYKFLYLKQIFVDAGLKLPTFIDEELVQM